MSKVPIYPNKNILASKTFFSLFFLQIFEIEVSPKKSKNESYAETLVRGARDYTKFQNFVEKKMNNPKHFNSRDFLKNKTEFKYTKPNEKSY